MLSRHNATMNLGRNGEIIVGAALLGFSCVSFVLEPDEYGHGAGYTQCMCGACILRCYY